MPMSHSTSSPIIPTMRYDDAKMAVDWLTKAFGFQRHLVVEDGSGGIAHAQMTFGNGMIMLGSSRDDEFGQQQKPPSSLTAPVTQSPYIVVANIDEHYARAVEAGANVVVGIRDEEHGGRYYSCRDPQGHHWNFGSYDPWHTTTDD